MHGDAIRVLVMRLSRLHASGGEVVRVPQSSRNAADFAAVGPWIVAHAGEPEDLAPRVCGRVHGVRLRGSDGADPRTPLRYVLPARALQ